MSFRANSGITLKTNVSGNEEQRVEYGGEVLDSGNAVPYIRTVNANTGEEIDRYFLINDSFLYYDGTKLVSTRPFMVQGDFYLPNNGKIFAPDSTGNEREVMNAASGDNFSLGYGNYANSRGNTTLYGNEINLTSRDKINLNGNIADGWHGTAAASIVTGGFVDYMTFGNIAVVRVQDVKFGTTAPASNNGTICSGLPHAAGSNFIFVLKTAQNEALSMRVKVTSAGLLQTHYSTTAEASTSRQWHGLAVYPYTR